MVLEIGKEPHPATQLQQRENHTNAVANKEDELEPIIEATDTSGSVLFDKVYQMMEKFASTRIGQFALERGDRVLRIFEDTAKWSLPHDVPLVRPLPWLPFLMVIILLRQFRIWLSLGALLIGNGPVTAHNLVYFIQTRRRKLRSIRVHGLKAIQQREHTRKALKNEKVGGLMVKLGQLFTIALCRPRINCEPAGVVFAAHKTGLQEILQSRESPRFTYKRQREDDAPEADLSCSDLLSKYANESSADDSDYVPIQEEEDTNNESTQSGISSNDTQGEYNMDSSDENAKGLNL
ncbi:PREDICTED: uncharacterized protein LOC108380715, partial [Rhagoletis zephyria]|uniref:uncharacterized protein LOC108380715 n=1 Tax=Rhagoletis zephyria TaxID=28612 RepID=UPI0008112902